MDSKGVRIQGQIEEAVGMRVTVAVSEKSAHEFSRMSTKKNYGRVGSVPWAIYCWT